MSRFTLFVPGRPVPQGSLTPMILKPKAGPPRPGVRNNPAVMDWRRKVTSAAIDKQAEFVQTLGLAFPITGPIGMVLDFWVVRPSAHFLPVNKKRAEPELRPESPRWPAQKPDLDKLIRAILDALTDAQVWEDDGQVVWVTSTKRYADPDHREGVRLSLGRMNS